MFNEVLFIWKNDQLAIYVWKNEEIQTSRMAIDLTNNQSLVKINNQKII